jgi:outer membrane protein assembly factor BamA
VLYNRTAPAVRAVFRPAPAHAPSRSFQACASLLLTLSAGLAPVPLLAQAQTAAPATRAEIAAAARRAAASVPVDEPISRVDRAFDYIEDSRLTTRIFDPPEGWFATVGGLAEGNGFTAGGGYRVPLGPGTLSARGVGSFRRSYLVDLTWHQPLVESGRVFVTANVGRRNEARLLFSGLGPRPALDESVDFALGATLVDGGLGVRLTPRVSARAGIGYLSPDVDVPAADFDDDDPTLSSYFTEATAPGLTSQPAFVVAHAGLLVDRRDAPNARAGGLYAIDVRRFDDRADGRASFTAARVEAQHYLPFWNRTRVLALRVVADQLRDDRGAAAPFYLRPTIGGSRTLRGFERQRFRDNGVLLMQAEYRYEINAFVMGAIFADAGQAAPSLRRMQWRHLETDYGVGLRVGYATGVALRTDLAFGGDVPVRLVFTFSAAF